MRKTIEQKITEKIGNDYKKLYEEYLKKNTRARRAFYALESTLKIARNGHYYYTGLKIEMKNNELNAYMHRMDTTEATVELI